MGFTDLGIYLPCDTGKQFGARHDASREARALWDLCSGSSTEKQIQDHILHHRELVYRNRLLMRQAVSLEPKVRSVFDGSYAGNVFLSCGSKPFAEFIKLGGHPQTYALDALSHAGSWYSQFLSKDSGSSTLLTFDIRKMDKSVLHDSAKSYCGAFSKAFLELPPWRLTWNIIMEVWKIMFLSKWVICRFHVGLPAYRI